MDGFGGIVFISPTKHTNIVRVHLSSLVTFVIRNRRRSDRTSFNTTDKHTHTHTIRPLKITHENIKKNHHNIKYCWGLYVLQIVVQATKQNPFY